MKHVLFFLILMPFLFFSCTKYSSEQKKGTFIFYRSGTSGTWDVLINGSDYGPVPYSPVKPMCNDNRGLRIQMPPGNYTIDFKSMDGYAWGNPKQVTLNANECKPYPLQ